MLISNFVPILKVLFQLLLPPFSLICISVSYTSSASNDTLCVLSGPVQLKHFIITQVYWLQESISFQDNTEVNAYLQIYPKCNEEL